MLHPCWPSKYCIIVAHPLLLTIWTQVWREAKWTYYCFQKWHLLASYILVLITETLLIHQIGYVFKDREEIAPFAEDAQQGDTVCWAKQQGKSAYVSHSHYLTRRLATRLSAFVIVGYPEKSFNTSTQKYEFYNSACIVDRHGQLVHTYRKNYLYETDLSWSEWSTDGFVTLTLDGIGRVGIGICMDLNEDTRIGNFFEIPFATYQRRAKPDLILLLMNWLKSPRSDEMIRHSVVKRYRHQVLTTTPKQHVDWCTLDYWISRLSPLWHGDRRVNVAICNRIGVERGKYSIISIDDILININRYLLCWHKYRLNI
jgi:protein N-terminal amidase